MSKPKIYEKIEKVESDLVNISHDYTQLKEITQAQDLKNNKTYKYSLQLSAEGQPQIKFEEVL